MQITKKEIIQKLYDIADANNLKLGREVQKVVKNETIPLDIIKLINKYDKNFLQIYDTYNTIYSSRNKNPLYRNLRNSHLDISEIAIAMSSLVTKILISCSKIENEYDRLIFAKAMNVDRINLALTDYSIFNKQEDLLQCASEVRELLEILYSE